VYHITLSLGFLKGTRTPVTCGGTRLFPPVRDMLIRTQPAQSVPSILSTVGGPIVPGADSAETNQTTQQAFRPPSTEQYGTPPHLEPYSPSAVLSNSGETRVRATDTRQAATSSLDWDPNQALLAPRPSATTHSPNQLLPHWYWLHNNYQTHFSQCKGRIERPFHRRGSELPSDTMCFWSPKSPTPNRTSIRSAVFVQLSYVTDATGSSVTVAALHIYFIRPNKGLPTLCKASWEQSGCIKP